jgi:Ca2+-binding EF-hand superfamily protein
MGEPFRGHNGGAAAFADWFAGADRNRDGRLKTEEMQADAARFFARLDVNHDGQIDPDELVQYEWDLAPEIQINSKLKRPRPTTPVVAEANAAKRKRNDEEFDVGGLQGAARYALLNLPEPVAAADADFNRAISSAEFQQAAAERFRLLDDRHTGALTLQGLAAKLPELPALGSKPKRRKPEEADRRVGVPLPPGP